MSTKALTRLVETARYDAEGDLREVAERAQKELDQVEDNESAAP